MNKKAKLTKQQALKLWNDKYKKLYEQLPKNDRRAFIVNEKIRIIKLMVVDGISPFQVAKFLKMSHTTIYHHLGRLKSKLK